MTGQIERIRVFTAVVRYGGFAAAARALGLSRTIATRYVAELEAELGSQLLVRTTRSVTPTLAGQTYFERCEPILRDLDRANASVSEAQHGLSGPLRVSAPLSLGIRFLPDVISQFGVLYPAVDLRISLTDAFVDILSDDYDMALRISEPPEDKSTIWRKICEVERVLVASPGYLAQRGSPRRPRDLAAHRCLGYSNFAGGATLRMTSAEGEEEAVTVALAFECNNGDVLGALAARGEGIALLPTFIVREALDSGALTALLPGWSAPKIWLTAFYPPYVRLPAKVAAFTSFVEGVIAADPSMIR